MAAAKTGGSSAADWQKHLKKLKGVLARDNDVHNPDRILRFGSPSVDFTYGNSWGLPFGMSQALFGYPKGGKSLLAFQMTGQLHKDHPEAHVIKFDTEFRDHAQLSPEKAASYGIDLNRYLVIQTNKASEIFDQIETQIAAMCEEGFPLRLIIIDSINGIMGRRMAEADSIDNVQIGDQARTLQDGFKRILSVQRKYGISVLLTAQVRAEMDQNEIRRGNTVKMAASFGVQHYCEYFTFVERLKTVDGRTDMFKQEFINKSKTDLTGGADRTGHRIRVHMKDSSLGPAGRKGILTFDYERGLINQSHELFELGEARGLIEANGNWLSFNGFKAQKRDFVNELENNPVFAAQLRAALILDDNKRPDAPGVNYDNEVAVIPGEEDK